MDYHHLLEATGIVVSGVLFYSLAYGWFAPDDPRRRPLWVIALGLVWGAIAVVLMISRIQTTEGPFIDGRAIPIALIGLFEGWGAGVIAGLAAVAYRIYLGGSGATAGVVAILAVAVAGGLAHRWAGGTERVRIHHAFVLAVGTFFITFGAFELRGEPGRTLFARVWPFYLLLTVVGLPLLALLMQSIVERRLLAQERERFRAVLDDATDAVRIVDADSLLAMLSPVTHTRTAEQVAVYQVEPYVIAADVYGVAPHVGRGGWTWYTGSAGWMLRVALESVLGLRCFGGTRLELKPCVPDHWPGFTVRLRLPDGLTLYEITVANPERSDATVRTVAIDGELGIVADGAAHVPLVPDGRQHRVVITLGIGG